MAPLIYVPKGIDHGIVFPVWSIALRSLAIRCLSSWTSQVNERTQLLGNLRRRNRSRRDWYSAATGHISCKVKTHFLSRRVGIRIVALFRFGTWFGVHGPFPPVLPFNAQAAHPERPSFSPRSCDFTFSSSLILLSILSPTRCAESASVSCIVSESSPLCLRCFSIASRASSCRNIASFRTSATN